jgi:hypothetical protein
MQGFAVKFCGPFSQFHPLRKTNSFESFRRRIRRAVGSLAIKVEANDRAYVVTRGLDMSFSCSPAIGRAPPQCEMAEILIPRTPRCYAEPSRNQNFPDARQWLREMDAAGPPLIAICCQAYIFELSNGKG